MLKEAMSASKRRSPSKETEVSLQRICDWLAGLEGKEGAPLLVGIGGPGGGGKSYLVESLLEKLDDVSVLHLDDFRLPRADRKKHGRYGSHPEGNDLKRLREVLENLKQGRAVQQPVYCPEAGSATRERTVEPERLVLVDGEIAVHTGLRDEFDALILVYAHWRTQLNARLSRDMELRHCDLEKAIHIFLESNLRDYPRFSEGIEEEADVVVYRTASHGYRIHKFPA